MNPFSKIFGSEPKNHIERDNENKKIIIDSFDSNSPIKVAELVKKTNMSNKIIGVYRDRMIKIGILKSPSYGYLEFTLPRFYKFIKSRY